MIHANYPHTDRTHYGCAACERPRAADCPDRDTSCVGDHGADDYGTCPVCLEPLDYCPGHASAVGDALTAITEAPTADAARTVCAGLSVAILRGVADLCYAVDYPDTAGRAVLTREIIRAARA